MLDFLEARLETLLRTSRSLLRIAKRDLIAAVKETEVAGRHEAELTKAADSGDVDAVVKIFDEYLAEITGAKSRVLHTEESVALVEYRSEEKLSSIGEFLTRLLAALKNVKAQDLPDEKAAQTLDSIIKHVTLLQKNLSQLANEGFEELKKQFIVVEREATGEHGSLQEWTWDPAPLMNSMRQLWKLRGKYRTALKEEGEVQALSQHCIIFLNEFLREKNPKHRAELFGQFRKDGVELEREFGELGTILKQMEGAYTLIIKTAERIFHKLDEEELFEQQFLQKLQREGFPQQEWQGLKEKLTSSNLKTHEKLQELLNILRRERRVIAKAA